MYQIAFLPRVLVNDLVTLARSMDSDVDLAVQLGNGSEVVPGKRALEVI